MTDSLSNGRALPVDVFAEPQDSAVNRGVVSPQPPSWNLSGFESMGLLLLSGRGIPEQKKDMRQKCTNSINTVVCTYRWLGNVRSSRIVGRQ